MKRAAGFYLTMSIIPGILVTLLSFVVFFADTASADALGFGISVIVVNLLANVVLLNMLPPCGEMIWIDIFTLNNTAFCGSDVAPKTRITTGRFLSFSLTCNPRKTKTNASGDAREARTWSFRRNSRAQSLTRSCKILCACPVGTRLIESRSSSGPIVSARLRGSRIADRFPPVGSVRCVVRGCGQDRGGKMSR